VSRDNLKGVLPSTAARATRKLANFLRGRSAEAAGKSGEKSAEWYDQTFEDSPEWSYHYSISEYYFLWAVIADRITRAEIGSVMEVGCGSGQLAALLRDKGLRRYCGLDFSAMRVARAREVCPEFEFVEANAFTTDLLDTFPYDAVVSTEFLEHVEEDIEIIRRIRPGRRLLGTVPNFPYVSHVRHFQDIAGVTARYAEYFSEFRVDAFLADSERKTFFLIDGVRK